MSSSTSLRPYRATFILDTRDLQESLESLIQKIKDAVVVLKGTISKSQNLGLREFARATDRKFPAGHYFQVELEGPASLPVALKERFRLDRSVNRVFVETR